MPDKRVTITDVAHLAGVSVATASVVINNKAKYVAPVLRRRVLEAVQSLNYQPNLVARSLKVQETRTIGLILTNITSPVTPPSVRLVQHYAREHGFDMLLAATEEDLNLERSIVANMLSKRVDGLILCPADSDAVEHLQYAASLIPVVAIERAVPGACSVVTDNDATSYAAAAHLVAHGRQRIGLIHMPLQGSNTRQRVGGFRHALIDRGCYLPELFCETDYVGSSAFDLACTLIAKRRADAVMATSQSIAMGVVRACKHLGVEAPADVAVFGYDDVPWMELTTPPVSTTQQPIAEIAQRACEILFATLGGQPSPPEVEVIPSRLILRASCGCL
jgi:DNA-binding LacI/PurR family transcriptional regulator